VVPAAIYARISSDPTGAELGVTRQLEDCRRLAEQRGLTVAEEYVDDDRSAWSGKLRPAYRRMLDDIRAGSVGTVLVWHADRLHRQPRELEEYIEVCEPGGVPTLACVSGPIDLSNPDGRLIARMLGAVAAHESDSKSRRIRRKTLELAMAGQPSGGGTRPFGYQADRRTLDPDEAAAVRGAVARVLAGDSLRAVARDLNERGITTSAGGPWSIQTLRRMLLSARISGQREHRGEIVAVGDWAPIITPEETTRLRARLNDPDRLTRRTVRRYLLSGGLLRCGLCDAVLTARPREGGDRRYVCSKGPGQPGCGRIGVLADPLESLIVEAVLYRLDTPELAAALAGVASTNADAAAAGDALALDQAQLDELARAHGERLITLREWLAARAPIEARIDAAKRRLSRLTHTSAIEPYVGASSALRAVWADLPLNSQRSIVAAILDRAIVRPAVPGRTRFDPARVEPVWRV
jgi:site-specific DNA recombinase